MRFVTLPGDILFTHRPAWPAKAIGFGQRLRGAPADARWTHVAVFVSPDVIIEALGHGVTASRLSKYDGVEQEIVSINASDADRREIALFAWSCVGRSYNWLEIVSMGLTQATGLKFIFGRPGTLICSALAAEALCRGPYIFDQEPFCTAPYQLHAALKT